MESRAYNFSTALKRSTLLESKVIPFRLDSDSAPRMKILRKGCPTEVEAFTACMIANNKDDSKCANQMGEMDKCGKVEFRKYNNDPNYTF